MTELVTDLPSNWATFVDQVLLGAEPADAAKLCGYASPRAASLALMRHPQVRKALATAAETRLECEAVPLALDVVAEILKDRDPKARAVRAKLAIAVLDRVRSKEDKAGVVGKDLSNMTLRELEQFIAQVGARPGEMRDVTPDAPTSTAPQA